MDNKAIQKALDKLLPQLCDEGKQGLTELVTALGYKEPTPTIPKFGTKEIYHNTDTNGQESYFMTYIHNKNTYLRCVETYESLNDIAGVIRLVCGLYGDITEETLKKNYFCKVNNISKKVLNGTFTYLCNIEH